MERSFIAITAIAATLMFASVWKATEPRSTEVPAVVDTDPISVTAAAAPSALLQRKVVSLHPTPAEEPYNVVRPAYGRSVGGGSESSVVYSGCREVRAAGAAPLYRGSPGYRADMDGDGDGIACEDYRR